MSEFDDIRPLYDEEVPGVIAELLEDPEFERVAGYIIPDMDWNKVSSLMKTFKTKADFQKGIVRDVVTGLAERTTTSLDIRGASRIEKNKGYTFMSNHRDIILDAGFLCILLFDQGLDTTEIAIGDNLLIHPWIEKLVRLNKSFIVRRGVSVRQMLEVSKHLSKYIHYTINEKNQSIWIAQREGRSKDSNDHTQESLIKMLSLYGHDFLSSIKALNIVPLSISYEYDPCDYLKAKEFQLKRDNPDYKKSPLDDLINMETGLFGFKGEVHFQIGFPINPQLDQLDPSLEKQQLVTKVAEIIDREIHLNYRFYPGNYIAYDRLTGENRFTEKYTKEHIQAFDEYLQKKIDLIQIPDKNVPFLMEKLLQMYVNPLKNNLIAKGELKVEN